MKEVIKTKYERNVNRDDEKDKKSRYILRWAKKLKAIEFLGGCCTKCKESAPWKLSFHHIGDKDEEINKLFGSRKSWPVLKKEIEKCELLCENCHREVHYIRENIRENIRQSNNKKILFIYKDMDKCQKCGYNNCQRALEFHHLNENNKEIGIVKLICGNSWKTVADLQEFVLNEVDKCIILCSNCHKDHHFDKDRYFSHQKEIIYKKNNIKTKNRVDANEVIRLYDKGLDKHEIASILKCSHQRVYELIRTNRK